MHPHIFRMILLHPHLQCGQVGHSALMLATAGVCTDDLQVQVVVLISRAAQQQLKLACSLLKGAQGQVCKA